MKTRKKVQQPNKNNFTENDIPVLNKAYKNPKVEVDELEVDGYYFLSGKKIATAPPFPCSKRKRIEPQQNNSYTKILQSLPAPKRRKTSTIKPAIKQESPRPTLHRGAKDKAKIAIYLSPIQYNHFKLPVAEPVRRSRRVKTSPKLI